MARTNWTQQENCAGEQVPFPNNLGRFDGVRTRYTLADIIDWCHKNGAEAKQVGRYSFPTTEWDGETDDLIFVTRFYFVHPDGSASMEEVRTSADPDDDWEEREWKTWEAGAWKPLVYPNGTHGSWSGVQIHAHQA